MDRRQAPMGGSESGDTFDAEERRLGERARMTMRTLDNLTSGSEGFAMKRFLLGLAAGVVLLGGLGVIRATIQSHNALAEEQVARAEAEKARAAAQVPAAPAPATGNPAQAEQR